MFARAQYTKKYVSGTNCFQAFSKTNRNHAVNSLPQENKNELKVVVEYMLIYFFQQLEQICDEQELQKKHHKALRALSKICLVDLLVG